MKPTMLVILATTPLLCSIYMLSTRSSTASVQKATPAVKQFEQGRRLYNYWCSTCHGAGVGAEGRPQLPGTAALQEKYQGDPPALLEERSDLTPEIVSFFVRSGSSVMPFFRKTEISDQDLNAISTYLTRSKNEPEK